MRGVDPLWVVEAERWVPLIDQVLDQVVERGNPADANHLTIYGHST